MFTLISTPSTVSSERRIGLPTKLGKMAVGKLAPAKPHLTNCKNSYYTLFYLLFPPITNCPLNYKLIFRHRKKSKCVPCFTSNFAILKYNMHIPPCRYRKQQLYLSPSWFCYWFDCVKDIQANFLHSQRFFMLAFDWSNWVNGENCERYWACKLLAYYLQVHEMCENNAQ